MSANGHADGNKPEAVTATDGKPDPVTTTGKDQQDKEAPDAVVNFLVGFSRLFFTKKFFTHRVVGLVFLVLYIMSLAAWVVDYDNLYRESWLLTAVPAMAVLQTITAIYTFTFLPRKIDGGYVNDVGSISYQFVCENLFFVLILAFQYLYFQERYYSTLKTYLWPVEYAFVFLPYWWRTLFPQTRLRDSLDNLKENRSTYQFYLAMNWLVRNFYLFGKHIIGFHLNYIRFANAARPEDIKYVYLTSLSGSFATTIAVFLHTLRFKRYLPGWVAFTIYIQSFAMGGIAFLFAGRDWFLSHPYILLISLGGLLANRIPKSNRLFDAYQIVVMALFHFGLVQAYGSWGDVARDVQGVAQWVVKEGVQGGNWVGMAATVVAQVREVVGAMVANPAGLAGKVW